MSLTIPELKALSFGYLTGKDLLRFCAGQLLIKQAEVDNDCLQAGCTMAFDEMTGKLHTMYDLADELAKPGDAVPDIRAQLIVKIASIFAIRNILGNAQNIAEPMMNHFDWADRTVKDLRNAQDSTPKVKEADNKTVGSHATLIDSSFNYLG